DLHHPDHLLQRGGPAVHPGGGRRVPPDAARVRVSRDRMVSRAGPRRDRRYVSAADPGGQLPDPVPDQRVGDRMLTSRTPPFSRYFCPLDCGWFHDAPEPGLWDEGPPISMRPDETMQDAVSRMAGGVLLDRIQKIETALREHVEKHTL